jgi:hypothetical protein
MIDLPGNSNYYETLFRIMEQKEKMRVGSRAADSIFFKEIAVMG